MGQIPSLQGRSGRAALSRRRLHAPARPVKVTPRAHIYTRTAEPPESFNHLDNSSPDAACNAHGLINLSGLATQGWQYGVVGLVSGSQIAALGRFSAAVQGGRTGAHPRRGPRLSGPAARMRALARCRTRRRSGDLRLCRQNHALTAGGGKLKKRPSEAANAFLPHPGAPLDRGAGGARGVLRVAYARRDVRHERCFSVRGS